MGKSDKNGDFAPLVITDELTGRNYFGGDQGWYKENTRYYGGCGSVAGANVIRTLAVKYPDLFKDDIVSDDFKKYSSPVMDKSKYTELMSKVYKFIGAYETPVINLIYNRCRRDNKIFKKLIPTFGLSVDRFIRRLIKYCEKSGLKLHAECISTVFCGYDKGLDFIKDGLNKGGAVVIMTSYNKHELTAYGGRCGCLEEPLSAKSSMKCHFATIAGLDENLNLTISTWGKTMSVNYDELYKSWQSRKAFTSALIYFEPTRSSAQCRSDRVKSFYTVFRSMVNTLVGKSLLK